MEESRAHFVSLTALTDASSRSRRTHTCRARCRSVGYCRPKGYNLDHNRIQGGRGEKTWQRATERI